jgi:EamA domain-containing membrane protein RarD
VLSVLAGWLFFHERNITDKLIAACVMFCGVLILYLPLPPLQAVSITVLTLAGTRHEKLEAA